MKVRSEKILIVEDEGLIRWSMSTEFSQHGYQVLEADTKKKAMKIIEDGQPDLIILDQILPDGTGLEILEEVRNKEYNPIVVMLTAVDRAETAVLALKLGAADYLTKPINLEELSIIVGKLFENVAIRDEIKRVEEESLRRVGFGRIIGSSPAIEKVKAEITRVAQSNTTTVLITGETGTGKELFARAIHNLSTKPPAPFIPVSCSAIPEGLIESELFGHERGAFTNAHSLKKGIFEQASGGTIFLDEIGDISLSTQVKLLRVLEEKVFRRIGGNVEIGTDTRLISATNRLLEKLIAEEIFREDLFFRLNVFSIEIPPLKERDSDIILLAEYFVQHFNAVFSKRFTGISDESKDLLLNYQWPGNVRELRNMIERATLLGKGEQILPNHLKFLQMDMIEEHSNFNKSEIDEPLRSLNDIEKSAILRALESTNNNQSHAARLLKITRETLRYRMKKYGLIQNH